MEAEAYGDAEMFIISHFQGREKRLIGDEPLNLEEEMIEGVESNLVNEGVSDQQIQYTKTESSTKLDSVEQSKNNE